jgi:hypothetical protein
MGRIAGIMLVLSAAAVTLGVATGSSAAGAAGAPDQAYSWSQRAVCPASGLTLGLRTSHTTIRYSGAGASRQWSVQGTVVVTAPGHRGADYTLSYVGQDSAGGGTTVTGRSVQIALGSGPVAVDGTAYLAPDGSLGRTTGSVSSICSAFGA